MIAAAVFAAFVLVGRQNLDPARKSEIRAVLCRSLTPKDLSMTAVRLRRRIKWIGRSSGLFDFNEDEQSWCYLKRVAGPQPEWTIVVNASIDDMVGVAGFWLGLRMHHVATFSLPDLLDHLEGPISGEWRRRGPYLLAAGMSMGFHSPSFGEGTFLVLRDTSAGLKLLQRGSLYDVLKPVVFKGKKSNDLLETSKDGEFETLEASRGIYITRTAIWHFRYGKYWPGSSHSVQDEVWAFDRLATAVRLKRMRWIASTIPNPALRRSLVPKLRTAIAQGQTELHGNVEEGLGLSGSDHPKVRFWIHFVHRVGHWIAAKVTL